MSGHGKEAVRLCEHVVRQAFGDVVCRVASTLLNRGRLADFSIARLSGISRKATLAALLILIQHNLVGSSGASALGLDEEEVYAFDVQECLLRLRWGRILAITQEKLGLAAVEVVRQLMMFGELTVPEITTMCGGQYDAHRATEIGEAIMGLVRNRFLHPTHPDLHILLADQVDRRTAHKRSNLKIDTKMNMLSAVQLENSYNESLYEITNERSDKQVMAQILVQSRKPGDKKKRKKGGEEFDYSLRQEVYLRLNHDRFGVIIRDELIVKATEDRWNRGAAIVMRALLDASIDEESTLANARTLRNIGVNEIGERIDKRDFEIMLAGMAGSSSRSAGDLIKQYLSVMAGEDQALGNGAAFCSRDIDSSPGYRVELDSICQRLRASILTELVKEMLGIKAARVFSVLIKTSVASETVVRDCAMVPLKEARSVLSSLQKLAFVETQEVPKTSIKSRIPGVTTASGEYHYWRVDQPRVYNLLLTTLYKTLGNILQRKAAEIDKKRLILAREERAKAMQSGREALADSDRQGLEELEDTLRKLTLGETRTELVVFILRDLPGLPHR